MKVLYAIQGTGNGHISRARDIIPELRKHCQLHLFVSGAQAEVQLPYPVKYRSKGLSFYFGKKGGIDFIKTFRHNSSRAVLDEIKNFPVENYDLVINDFEPISAWAAKQKDIPCVALSHQSALLSSKVPKPKLRDPIGELLLHKYAPAKDHVGFHFKEYDKDIFTPVIREAIRIARVENKKHYTVYLPAFDDKKLVLLLSKFRMVNWHIFSKHTDKAYHIGKISVFPIRDEDFVSSMSSASGVFCGAGFESPAEALYMGKKLLVLPMKSQYEQHCNAASLKELKVPVLKSLKKRSLYIIEEWIESKRVVNIDYPDVAANAVARALNLGSKFLGLLIFCFFFYDFLNC